MLKIFEDKKILLAYYGGSTAYGTKTNESDKDIIIVLEDFNGSLHLTKTEENIEYFVFCKKSFIEKMEFSDNLTPYFKIFNDDILSEQEPIYLDESFIDTFEKYKNRDFSEYIKKYLDAVIKYYDLFLEEDKLRKNMYHLYRIEEQLKRYFETGEFILNISDEVLEKIMILKNNFESDNEDIINELRLILVYLKGVRKDVNNWSSINNHICSWNR